MDYAFDLSVIVPLYNEEASLPELTAWIGRVVAAQGWRHEIILVDDGSTDGSWSVIESLREKDPAIHGIAATTASPPPCIAVSNGQPAGS